MIFPPDLLIILRITVIALFAAWAGKVGLAAYLTFPGLLLP